MTGLFLSLAGILAQMGEIEKPPVRAAWLANFYYLVCFTIILISISLVMITSSPTSVA